MAFSHWCREEETHCSNTSTPVKSDKELQTEKVVEMPVRRKRGSLSPPSASGSSGKRKRKIQLLSSRRGDQLALGWGETDLPALRKEALSLAEWEVTLSPAPVSGGLCVIVPPAAGPAPAASAGLLHYVGGPGRGEEGSVAVVQQSLGG